MQRPTITAVVAAALIAAFIAAATEARPGKSFNQCQREATYLGWRAHDDDAESGGNGFSSFMARCQFGTDEQTARQYETYRNTRNNREAERQIARRQEREQVRYEQAQRAETRRALAQAEPRYRQQAVSTLEFCRGIAESHAWHYRDRPELSRATTVMQSCMRGSIPR